MNSYLIFQIAFSGNILGGLSKDTISELDALTHENKDQDMKDYILNKARVEAEKKTAILENMVIENKEKLIKTGKFDEKEMNEDLFLFTQIVNENRREELLDCEETIDDNIEYITKLIHSKI